jgi:hypothetical protein
LLSTSGRNGGDRPKAVANFGRCPTVARIGRETCRG